MFFMFLLSHTTFSQDIIYKTDGNELKVKIIEIDDNYIKYKYFEQLSGPLRNISKSEVFMIKYNDGSEEKISGIITHQETENFENQISFIPEMVLVKGGTFKMGSNNGKTNVKPMHSVTLDDFFIGKYEVTQLQWKKVIGSSPSYFEECDQCPVEYVSWNDIQTFLEILNKRTGKKYRLPTEAEWEFAARGGNQSNGYIYSGGNNIENVAWYKDNSGFFTHLIGKKYPNELGIFDMTGNVYEWCNDKYNKNYYQTSPSCNPSGPLKGSTYILRGGSFNEPSPQQQVIYRFYGQKKLKASNVGFRLAESSK